MSASCGTNDGCMGTQNLSKGEWPGILVSLYLFGALLIVLGVYLDQVGVALVRVFFFS